MIWDWLFVQSRPLKSSFDISTIISHTVHLFNLLVPHWLQEIRCSRPADEKRRHLWRSGTGNAVASSRRRWEADLLPNSGWSGTPIRCAGRTCAGRPSAPGSGQTAWSHKAEGSIGTRGPWTAKQTCFLIPLYFLTARHDVIILNLCWLAPGVLCIGYINTKLWYCFCVTVMH